MAPILMPIRDQIATDVLAASLSGTLQERQQQSALGDARPHAVSSRALSEQTRRIS